MTALRGQVSEVRYQAFLPDGHVWHEYANLFPMMSPGAELDAFEHDVRDNGVREAIVLYEGKVLDGRNRFMAARNHHQEFPCVDYLGDDPLGFVISLNLKRRHLDTTQRGSIAAKIANFKLGDNQHTAGSANLRTLAPISHSTAADLMNVSERTVETAAKVQRDGIPELNAMMDAGRVTASAAAEVATLDPEEQAEVVAAGPAEVKEIAREVREGKHVRGTLGTGENEWYTPAAHVDIVRSVLGTIDLDPASSAIAQQTVKAAAYFDETADGLKQKWTGNVWLNPPYAQPAISHFADKMVRELADGHVKQAIMLTHNYTDTAWFQKLAKAATAICFTRGRVKFVSPQGEIAAPTQGQAFFYFGPETDKFVHAFRNTGFVVEVRT